MIDEGKILSARGAITTITFGKTSKAVLINFLPLLKMYGFITKILFENT